MAIISFHSKACWPMSSWMPMGTVRMFMDFVSVSANRNSFQEIKNV